MAKSAASIQPISPAFDLSTEIPVMEHFYTLQGEGTWSGTPTYFIRLAGCNVGCIWCDVKDSWEVSEKQIMPIADLVTAVVSSGCGRAVITGGEPAMYDLNPLTKTLKKAGIIIHIETSGAYPLQGKFDWVCLSPKKFLPPVDSVYAQADELKIIIFNSHDFKWAESEAEKCDPNKTVFYLQAEWSKRELFYPKIVSHIQSNPKWRLSVQTHKYIDIP